MRRKRAVGKQSGRERCAPAHRSVVKVPESRLLLARSLDSGFGTNGYLLLEEDRPTDLVVQADGKVLLTDNARVVRYLADGKRERVFELSTDVRSRVGNVSKVAVQPDGKVLAASQSPAGSAVMRYTAEGTMDRSFGAEGVAVVPVAGNWWDGGISTLAVAADGDVIAGGRLGADLLLARFDSSGDFDPTFDDDGILMLALDAVVPGDEPSRDEANAVWQNDGDGSTLVWAGSEVGDGDLYRRRNLFLRVTADGRIDESFGEEKGLTLLDAIPSGWSGVFDVDRLGDGALIVGGSGSHGTTRLRRLDADGGWDKEFGAGGEAAARLPFGANDMAVFGGHAFVTRGDWIARFDSDGREAGVAQMEEPPRRGSNYELADVYNHSIAMQPDGKMLVAGSNSFYEDDWGYNVHHHVPFGDRAGRVGDVIEAKHYDYGGEGVAYHALRGVGGDDEFRFGGPVVEENGGATGAHRVVGRAGEWMDYTVRVAEHGRYGMELRVAGDGRGGMFHVEVDGRRVTKDILVPDGGGAGSFGTIGRVGVQLEAGEHVVRLIMDRNSASGTAGRFDWLRITKQPTATPFYRKPRSLPGTIHAEEFDNRIDGVAYHDVTEENTSGEYRSTGVDVEETTDRGGFYAVGTTRKRNG